MKNADFIISLTVFVIVSTVNGAVEETTDCRKLMMIIAKKQLKVFGECSRDMRAEISDPTEYQSKIQCVVKCAMKREKMLDDEYQITKASVQSFMDTNVPKMFHEIGHIFMDNCLALFDGKFDTNDPHCKTYGDFIKCMQEKIGDVC